MGKDMRIVRVVREDQEECPKKACGAPVIVAAICRCRSGVLWIRSKPLRTPDTFKLGCNCRENAVVYFSEQHGQYHLSLEQWNLKFLWEFPLLQKSLGEPNQVNLYPNQL